MNLFYVPDVKGDLFTLGEDESRHAIKVLRLKEEDSISLIDGVGGIYKCSIVEAHHKRCLVKVLSVEREFEKRNFSVQIAIAPTKSIDRVEWFVEKATEIGIDRVSPILCERSERKRIKEERLVRVAVSGAKQSLKAYVPVVDELTPFKKFVESDLPPNRYIAHCEDFNDRVLFKDLVTKGEDCVILIGPEGDFSLDEISLATANGFKQISLGNSRLRTETAALVAVHTVALLNE